MQLTRYHLFSTAASKQICCGEQRFRFEIVAMPGNKRWYFEARSDGTIILFCDGKEVTNKRGQRIGPVKEVFYGSELPQVKTFRAQALEVRTFGCSADSHCYVHAVYVRFLNGVESCSLLLWGGHCTLSEKAFYGVNYIPIEYLTPKTGGGVGTSPFAPNSYAYVFSHIVQTYKVFNIIIHSFFTTSIPY